MSITVDGEEKLYRELDNLIKHCTDLRGPVWRAATRAAREAWQDGFYTEGATTGERWPGLEKRYEINKAKRYPFMPPMRATDALYLGMMGRTSESITDEQPQALTLGVGGRVGRYGLIHRQGYRGKRRDVSQLGQWGRDRIARAIKKEFRLIVKSTGFIQTEEDF
jgi:hypothetical protein